MPDYNKNAIIGITNELLYLMIMFTKLNDILLSKNIKNDDFNIIKQKIDENLYKLTNSIINYDYRLESSYDNSNIQIPNEIMKRPELLIAIYQDSDQEQFISEWLPGRITYISKDNLYVKIEDYSIGNNKRTLYSSR